MTTAHRYTRVAHTSTHMHTEARAQSNLGWALVCLRALGRLPPGRTHAGGHTRGHGARCRWTRRVQTPAALCHDRKTRPAIHTKTRVWFIAYNKNPDNDTQVHKSHAHTRTHACCVHPHIPPLGKYLTHTHPPPPITHACLLQGSGFPFICGCAVKKHS